MITVRNLVRTFEVTQRAPGLQGALRSVVRRETRSITAVDDITFEAHSGQVLGVLGPNGAGKTTALKCIAGLLTPTSGVVEVLGHEPARRSPDFLRRLGFVMGQRWQLHIDLPVWESFELHRVMYGIGRVSFVEARDELVDMLGLEPYVMQQARKLSLGQRMRCEFAAALLHRPSVVLLDEPTLGLDFESQVQIRRFVAEYVRRSGACVLLTSHYLADIDALCEDVLAISQGRLTYRGSLRAIQEMADDSKRVRARLAQPLQAGTLARLGSDVTVVDHSATQLVLTMPHGRAGAVVQELERVGAVTDITMGAPPLEESLSRLYRGSSLS
ncbi:ABC transporter ATP-binding protein [Cellulomonas phragmiteti]|uniref:ABC transporter n=1 Tax=Cellulomonas phragmiteti TaxID=478780 RepID=A0ABQ4DR30_9CELL|nr:ATP-binding cassette domain-containing protein [Cellulomonas phragmiteti]GIG41804.1 ABC transporter [Cellulomonas phragmiteti]